VIAIMVAKTLAEAQQSTGTPGSPNATKTVDAKGSNNFFAVIGQMVTLVQASFLLIKGTSISLFNYSFQMTHVSFS